MKDGLKDILIAKRHHLPPPPVPQARLQPPLRGPRSLPSHSRGAVLSTIKRNSQAPIGSTEYCSSSVETLHVALLVANIASGEDLD